MIAVRIKVLISYSKERIVLDLALMGRMFGEEHFTQGSTVGFGHVSRELHARTEVNFGRGFTTDSLSAQPEPLLF